MNGARSYRAAFQAIALCISGNSPRQSSVGVSSQSWHSKVNHTANRAPNKAVSRAEADYRPGWEPYLTVAAMFTYAVLVGLASNPVTLGASITISTLAYFLAVYLYYGVARLAFTGRNYLLWASGILAVLISFSLSGLAGLWQLLMGWSMILFAGTVIGRLSLSGRNQSGVYFISLLTVLVFALAQSAPMWKAMMSGVDQVSGKLIEDARQNLLTLGYGADAVRQSLDSTARLFKVLVRLVPSLTVLGAVLPFSAAYLLFSHRLDKRNYPGRTVAPFVLWKMPFAAMPLLIITILIRLLGSDTLGLAADNVLAFLSLFYSITGLALIEFYLRRFRFSTLMKALFYIAFFLSQFIGLFVAAFLGFVDSFVDWRKVQQLSLEEK
jgi:hypothetical protein